MRQWQPAREAGEAPPEGETEQTANERIQQRMQEQAAERTWPATWNGREHTPARV